MARTYENEDGVLVVEAGPVALESASDIGEPEQQEEEAEDEPRPGAGE